MAVDMSEMAEMMKSLGGADDEFIKSMDEMEVSFEEKVARMEAINGVSNWRNEFDRENLKYEVLFDFANVDALNAGMSEFYRDSTEVGSTKLTTFFIQKGNTFERTENNGIVDNFKKGLQEDGEEELDLEMAAMLFGDASYKQTIEFDNKIKSVSNKEYVISDDKKVASWEYRLFIKEDFNKKPKTKIVIK
ncbi:hypothetical protein OB69_12365 [Roseivirga seohaensis subsp. aquiponti]|uniref:Uncharacterized protein n=2 Tax=Roseivirga seohaensis TaxID=1914963 RepID=A0A0L8AJI2_9BACT|nr:hypothetical protein OB69_12365 [Roseivirga seohaensis subsp. aquiponti]